MPETLQEQLVKHLADVHSIEEQALVQMRVAPRMARDPELARAFREHIAETEEQERLVRGRLEAHGADPSKAKDLVARAGGVGMVLFARSQPDTPGKLVAHAYSYEHMELAAYELLAIVAQRADDAETVEAAGTIRHQEATMAERLAAGFDRAVEASPRCPHRRRGQATRQVPLRPSTQTNVLDWFGFGGRDSTHGHRHAGHAHDSMGSHGHA